MVGGRRQCPAPRGLDGGAAGRKEKPTIWREKRKGEGAGDRNEKTMEGIEGAAGFYTRAKRRGARDARSGRAKPEGAVHRQRQDG